MDTPEQQLLHLLRTMGELPIMRLPEDIQLSPPAVAILSWVSKTPGCGVLDIAKGLNVSAPTVSVGIRRLEKNGWLTRGSDPNDRRARPLFLTDKAKSLMTTIRSHRAEMLHFFLSGLGTQEQEQLLNLLEKAILKMKENLKDIAST